MPPKAKPLVERFWPKVDKAGGPDACWPWTGGKVRKGYGAFPVRLSPGKWTAHFAHRVAFALATGTEPGDQFVCHRCDNPPCCNPAHLFLGTQTDNMGDASRKGRCKGNPTTRGDAHYLRQRTHCKHGHPFDEVNTLWLPNGARQCRACNREGGRRFAKNHPKAPKPKAAHYNAVKTHCKRGHPFDEANTYLSRGRRYCVTCRRLQKHAVSCATQAQ